jgi:hypothetical protein
MEEQPMTLKACNKYEPMIPPGDVIFTVGGQNPREMLRLCADGRILVRGVEADNDKAVVDAFKAFIAEAVVKTKFHDSVCDINAEKKA